MSAHKEFQEDLASYALHAEGLPPDERRALEKHLSKCPSCRRELELLRGDASLVAMSAPEQTPPARARKRLMSAIAADPRNARALKAGISWPWAWIPSLAAAAVLALLAAFLWRQDTRLRATIASLEQSYSQQQAQVRAANQVLATLTDPAAARFSLSAAKTKPQPQGKAIYAQNRGSLIFLASNMPAPPPQKAYELWLIPASGAPIPAGVFKPGADGSAVVLNPPLPANVEAKTFAVTVEPEAGSSAPTTEPMM